MGAGLKQVDLTLLQEGGSLLFAAGAKAANTPVDHVEAVGRFDAGDQVAAPAGNKDCVAPGDQFAGSRGHGVFL